MIKCSRCSTDNRDTARFCRICSLRLPGTVVQGRYRILSVLGQGGMGAVYLVEDQRVFGKRWALKELLDILLDPADRPQAVQQFQQEAKMLVSLSHPNLPQISDYFSESGRQYLVMEYIEGETLEAILQKTSGFLPEAQVAEWAMQVCDVLDYLHGQKPQAIIFRDMKPANVMLAKDDKVKLIDFGIARLFQPGKTKDTRVMGTPGYAAPEQYGAGQTDARSDIYALGATMHHLLTRRDPSIQPHVFPPCQTLNSSVSSPMTNIVSKATDLDPNKRYQSAAEMKQALLGFTPASPQSAQSLPSGGGVVPQPIRWVQKSPLVMFLAYCKTEQRETTWVVESVNSYTTCTCLECGASVSLCYGSTTLKALLEAFCRTCKEKTYWVIHTSGRTCLGCGQRR